MQGVEARACELESRLCERRCISSNYANMASKPVWTLIAEEGTGMQNDRNLTAIADRCLLIFVCSLPVPSPCGLSLHSDRCAHQTKGLGFA